MSLLVFSIICSLASAVMVYEEGRDEDQPSIERDTSIGDFVEVVSPDERLPLKRSEIKYYLQHPKESPYQTWDVESERFNLDGRVWKNCSNNMDKLIQSFESTISLSTDYYGGLVFGCSGFFISENEIITAKHCVNECLCAGILKNGGYYTCGDSRCGSTRYLRSKVRGCAGDIYCATTNSRNAFVVDVVDVSDTSDVAHLRVSSSFKSRNYINLVSLNDINNTENLEVIVIGYPSVSRISDTSVFYTKDGYELRGNNVKGFYGDAMKNIKGIGIGNITLDKYEKEGDHLAPTWARSSGGPVIVVGQENIGIGVHTSGNPIRNVFVTTKDPFLAKYVLKKNKNEL